jgi:hypothetical protein
MTDSSINAGVDSQTGFALQRNTALFLLLENYANKFKEKDYFICLEHHEDFLFCFLDRDNNVEIIEAFQSKKKSPDVWKLNEELYNMISKLLNTGKALIADSIPKSNNYKHVLYFSTNQTTNLIVKENSKVVASVSVKENNFTICFDSLGKEIQSKIRKGINNEDLNDELSNLNFIYIDLNRTVEKQENELVGQLGKVFGSKIYNKEAAVKTLIELFREIEEKYNSGNKASLLDTSKRVTSKQVEEAFDILTSKSKCFDYWHKQSREVAIALMIKPSERTEFEFTFTSSFDFFKSFKEAEHRRILEFVKQNIISCKTFTDEENVAELFELFHKSDTTTLGIIELKAVIFAAFYEVTFKSQIF